MAWWIRKSGEAASRATAVPRAHFAALTRRFDPPAGDIHTTPGRLGALGGEWVRPAGTEPASVILYFHGGGFVAGSPQAHRPLVGRLARAAAANVFSPAYRLAPEHPFPGAVRDGAAAWRGLLRAGIPPGAMVLGGDGAGGGLAFSVLLAIREEGLALPAGVFALSPWADLTLSGWSMLTNRKSDGAIRQDILFRCARHYLGGANPADPLASPVFADFRDFPPVMVHAGAGELLRDDASRLGVRAGAAGLPVSVEIYEHMGYLFQARGWRPQVRASLDRLGSFVRARTARWQTSHG